MKTKLMLQQKVDLQISNEKSQGLANERKHALISAILTSLLDAREKAILGS